MRPLGTCGLRIGSPPGPGATKRPAEAGEQRQFAGVGELAVQFAGAQQLLAQARIGHLGDLATVAQVALQRAVGTTFPQRPEIGGEQFVGVETERAVVGSRRAAA